MIEETFKYSFDIAKLRGRLTTEISKITNQFIQIHQNHLNIIFISFSFYFAQIYLTFY